MNRLLSAVVAILCAAASSGLAQQGVRYDHPVTTVAGNVPFGASAPVLAIPNATVTICADGACASKATIYSNQALTVQTSNPIRTNGDGYFGFWAPAGTYFYQVKLPNNGTVVGIYPITLGGSGGGGGLNPVAETPAGTINGTNRTFTLSNVPVLLLLDLNGLQMTQGVDYTLSANVITFTGSIPRANSPPDILFANYFYGSTGSLTPFSQTPTGTLNGSNTAFTLTHSPVILFLTRNGVQLIAGTDYTLSGSSLTMTLAPQSGDIFNAQYFY